MKHQIAYIIISSSIISINACGQSTNNEKPINETPTIEKDSDIEYELNGFFRTYKHYALQDTIVIDLNGDEKSETIYYHSKNNKSGITIIDGDSKKATHLGMGVEMGDAGDDFSWADYWGFTENKKLTLSLIDDKGEFEQKEIILKYPTLFLMKKETGGGVIVYENGKYKWINISS